MRGYVIVMECKTADYEPWNDAIWQGLMCSWYSHKAQWWAFMDLRQKVTQWVSQWASVDKTCLLILSDASRVTILGRNEELKGPLISRRSHWMWQNVKSSPYSWLLVKNQQNKTNMSAIFAQCCPTTAGLRAQTTGSASCWWFFFLQFAWTHESSSSGRLLVCAGMQSKGKNAHAMVCRMLGLSVCQWGNGQGKFSRTDPLSLSDSFKHPGLFPRRLDFSSFTVWKDRFASVAMMKKHSMNPFIL